ncbi:MAG: N-terminal phage integrase SAM-like domain-containing protein [Dehalococcoidia bacterium]
MTTARRARGEGSISKRNDGRFMGRVTLPSGRVKTVYGRSRSDVAKKLRELLSHADQGIPIPEEDPQLRTFLAGWLTSIEHTVRPTTYRRYEQVVRHDLIPELGATRLSKLNPGHVQRLQAHCSSADSPRRRCTNVHAVLHRALNHAVRWGTSSVTSRPSSTRRG